MSYLDKFKRGEKLSGGKLNQLREQSINGTVAGVGMMQKGGQQRIMTPVRTPYTRGGSGGATMEWFSFYDMQTDYFRAYTWNPSTGTTGSTLINIALPFIFQRTPFDGVTVTYINPSGTTNDIEFAYTYNTQRNAVDSGGEITETQVIEPLFYVGEKIQAFETTSNVTVSGSWLSYVAYLPGRVWAADTDKQLYTAGTRTDLLAIMPPDSHGHTTGAYKRAYRKMADGTEYCITHIEVS